MTPVQWWYNFFKDSHPALTALALLALSIAPTTGTAERNWSAHGFIHNLRRNKLSYTTVKMLVYLYWNLRIQRKLANSSEGLVDDEGDQFDSPKEIIASVFTQDIGDEA